jgi:plastocyanin
MKVRSVIASPMFRLACLMAIFGGLTGGALAAVVQSVSQKGREFRPSEISVKRGETIEIINDDLDLLHHLYLRNPAFSFDSGDQAPGSKFSIAFPQAGIFTVLCAIHPKMKLRVTVE